MNLLKSSLTALLCIMLAQPGFAQEKILANYFDIEVNSPKKTEVTGRVHLERNKDVLTNPIPASYRFEIIKQPGNTFDIQTRFDEAGRIMGVLSLNNSLKAEGEQSLTLALKDGTKILNEFPVTVKVVKQTLWQTLFDRYKDVTVSQVGSRMYGRKKPKDDEVAKAIEMLEANNGEYPQYKFYHIHPKDYKPVAGKSIEHDWEVVCNNIGGLGYAYATSEKYGPKGDPAERERLKRALYRALNAYTAAIPVEGRDVVIDGKPIGAYTGDGFSNLQKYHLIEEQVATHQWVISDGLLAPAVHLMPELLADIKKGDKQAVKVYDNLVRMYQTAFAEVLGRRNVNNPDQRWGKITDTLRSSGAWTDANLGHRSRMMLALPIIWADYNRPITYVQYWYEDFYKGSPFKGMSYSPGWSPQGVVADVAYWFTKFKVPAYQYIQSGFQPDGTVSHHVGHGTDASMVAYGFGWLTESLLGFNQFKNTDFKLGSEYYQFPADHLERIYPKIIYNGRMDFLVSGRSYGEDLKKFVSNVYLRAIKELTEARSEDTKISNQQALDKIHNAVKKGQYQYSGTDAYWVNEFLVHRRGEHEKPFYASLKLKSKRTVGAEDFGKIRKSWYAGYGVLPVKVSGDEYSDSVMGNMDWHALPGLTEEWRSDAIPVGHSQGSLPGDNDVAGVTADGKTGLGIYHHLPRETYSSATANKTYHFIDERIVALGKQIQRFRKGQGKHIVTTVDQSALVSDLTIAYDGKTEVVTPSQSVNRSFTTSKPVWFHIAGKGYLILPDGAQTILVKTGKEINITDPQLANGKPNYIVAIDHGDNPTASAAQSYQYVALPTATLAQMPLLVARYQKEVTIKRDADAHALYDAKAKILQAGFFKGAKIQVDSYTIAAEQAANFILRDAGQSWQLTASNPAPDIDKRQLVFTVSVPLKAGKYSYSMGGVYPREGEFVTISPVAGGSKIVVELADSRDDNVYNYRTVLYNAVPVSITIPK